MLVGFSGLFILDGVKEVVLYRTHGVILLLFFSLFLYYVYLLIKQAKPKYKEKVEVEVKSKKSIAFFLLIGLTMLLIGSRLVVDGAVFIAENLGLSEYFISATLIAIGTSLPELSASFAAARKKETGLAIGNIIGSCIFNIFFVLGVTALINPIIFPTFIIVDLLILVIANLILVIFIFAGKHKVISRSEAIILLLLYFAYIVILLLRL